MTTEQRQALDRALASSAMWQRSARIMAREIVEAHRRGLDVGRCALDEACRALGIAAIGYDS